MKKKIKMRSLQCIIVEDEAYARFEIAKNKMDMSATELILSVLDKLKL